MQIRSVSSEDKVAFNRLAFHPLQSWQWGQFRKKTGIEVIRIGRYQKNEAPRVYTRGIFKDGGAKSAEAEEHSSLPLQTGSCAKVDKLLETALITIHPIPFTKWTIGYLPKSGVPSRQMLEKLVEVGKQYKCIFIKLEANIPIQNGQWPRLNDDRPLAEIVPSPHPLFTKYTFQLDLTQSEEELLKNMHPKTRYNIRIAQKHKVQIQEDNSPEAFQKYLALMEETTHRQKYFAHTRRYHELMWETLRQSKSAHLLTATYEKDGKTYTLVTWILFLFNHVLYYPYGASSSLYRNTMASNLLMWEAIRFGKNHGAILFDMWGALGPDPDPKDPWYGFHRFKQGYGATLVEFIGSFDLVINPSIYAIYNLLHVVREKMLKIKAYLFT